MAAPVGVLGGTFDPVHHGHLRSALELVEVLSLERLHLMPCAQPPHRERPACAAEHRAAMVELAVAREPRLLCDRRELRRDGPSYSIDSVTGLRGELGPERALYLILGYDALLKLDTWHRWLELLEVAHVVVIARPGSVLPSSGAVAQWLSAHRVTAATALCRRPAGSVLVQALRPLDIASTEIRAQLVTGRSPRYLLPEPVLDYIEEHKLYLREDTAA
ncbi:MAG: nicotinate-nucleotide adenylyltransferase [Parahaliea sp.]